MSLPIATDQLKLNGHTVTASNGTLSPTAATIPAHSKTACVDLVSGGYSTIQAAYDAIVASGVTQAIIQLGVGYHGALDMTSDAVDVEIVGIGQLSSCDIIAYASTSKTIRLTNCTISSFTLNAGTTNVWDVIIRGQNVYISNFQSHAAWNQFPPNVKLEGSLHVETFDGSGADGLNGESGETNNAGLGLPGSDGEAAGNALQLTIKNGAHADFVELRGGIGGMGGQGGEGNSGQNGGDGGDGGAGGNGGFVYIETGSWVGSNINVLGGQGGFNGSGGAASGGGSFGSDGAIGTFGTAGSFSSSSFAYPQPV